MNSYNNQRSKNVEIKKQIKAITKYKHDMTEKFQNNILHYNF